jgi:hypothetical protein
MFDYVFAILLSFAFQINALGGPAVLSLLSRHFSRRSRDQQAEEASDFTDQRTSSASPLVIAVEENHTVMDVWKHSLPRQYHKHVLVVRSYAEAAGYMAAHKAGIAFEALGARVDPIPVTYL